MSYSIVNNSRRSNLHYSKNAGRFIIYNGNLRDGCMAKYWYTKYTDIPDGTTLTYDHVRMFLNDINTGRITRKIINENINEYTRVLNGYLRDKIHSIEL